MLYKIVLFFTIIIPINFFGQQDSLFKQVHKLTLEIEEKKPPIICHFDILDVGKKANEFKIIGVLEIYNDSIIYHKFFKESFNSWSYVKKYIQNENAIKFIHKYSLDIKKYVPDCSHYTKGGIPGISGIPLNKKRMKRNIGYSNNEWTISFRHLESNYNFTNSFKSKLFKFKCLGLIKNIKSRIFFNRFIKIIENE